MIYTPGIMALSEPEYGDDADIAVINSNSVKIDDHMTNAFNNIAEPFDTTKAYEVGEIVVYEKVTYIFTAAKSAGAWDATKVEVKPLGTAIFEKEGGGASSLSDLTDTDIDTPVEGEVLTWNGEDWVNAEGTPTVTKTATGNPIELTDGADAPLVKCVTEIQGSQDLHGQDKPWVGGAYINKMPPGESKSTSGNGVTITSDGNGTYTFVGTCTQDFEVIFDCDEFTIPNADNSAIYLFNTQANTNTVFVFYENSTMLDTWSLAGINRVSTYMGMKGLLCNKYGMRLKNGVTYDLTIKPMLAVGTSYTAWTPYSNICPITAYTEGEIEVSDGDGNVTTHTTTFPSAIYRGSEDVVNGTVGAYKVKIQSDGTGFLIASNGILYNDSNILTGVSSVVADLIQTITDKYAFFNIIGGTVDLVGQEGKFGLQIIGNVIRIAICDSRFTTAEDFRTYLANDPLEIAYKLATPTTTPVTPTNLPVKSLSGYNHIESSTGEMEVEYITEEYQPLVDLISGSGNRFEGLDWDRASTLTLPDYTGYSYTPPCEGVLMSTSYGSVGSTIVKRTGYDDMNLSYRADTWSTAWIPVTSAEYTLKRGASSDPYPSGSWLKFIPWKITTGGSEGSSSCDYSTTEHVVGKWIDGKDVYEKTYTFSSLPSVGDWTPIDEDCGIDTLVDYSLMYTRSNGQIDNSPDMLRVAYNPPNSLGDLCYYPGGVGATHITVRYTKSTATTRSLSKGATDSLKADLSGVKGEGEEILKDDEKSLKIDESESIETKEEADETEENADEVQNETVTE